MPRDLCPRLPSSFAQARAPLWGLQACRVRTSGTNSFQDRRRDGAAEAGGGQISRLRERLYPEGTGSHGRTAAGMATHTKRQAPSQHRTLHPAPRQALRQVLYVN